MVDPALDDPTKPWCYFTHPTSCIGVPWMPGLNIQITPEGNLFNNSAELALFWGAEHKPLACRQRQFLDGWIPVVRDSWKDGASCTTTRCSAPSSTASTRRTRCSSSS